MSGQHAVMPPETAAQHARVNGASLAPIESHQYDQFYEKLFHLQDAVFAGKHPSLRLPEVVLKQFAAAQQQLVDPSTPRPSASSAFTKTPASRIEPILLEKSDELVKAETQLERRRIERALQEQVDAKQGGDCPAESNARLDVSAILAKAQELVKPISGLQPSHSRQSATSESIDDNSYYSSQAISWSSESADGGAEKSKGYDGTAAGSDVEVGEIQEAASSSRVNARNQPSPPQVLLEQQEDPIDRADQYSPSQLLPLDQIANERSTLYDAMDLEDLESDYSPPPVEGNSADVQQTHLLAPHARDPPVYMNQIRSPAAPQPARVSPLALGKVPAIEQTNNGPSGEQSMPTTPSAANGRRHGRDSGRGNTGKAPAYQSPQGPRSGVNNPRKRRRKNSNDESNRRASGKRRVRTPEAVSLIKEEPVSPPPFNFAESLAPRRRGIREYPDDPEILSSRDIRAPASYYREHEHQPVSYRYVEEPLPLGARVRSPAAFRRVERDDQDLRRVASLQYARRPYSPGRELVYAQPEVPVRAASHSYVERQYTQQPIYRSESVRPGAGRYIRADRSVSPAQHRDPYARARSPAIMAPPPRPIMIEDEYGNKYYAAQPEPVIRASVAPPSRRLEESYLERAATREPTLRPASRVYEPFQEGDAYQRMPPPSQRRYVGHTDEEFLDSRAVPARAYSVRPSEAVPVREEPHSQVREGPDRRAYGDDAPVPLRAYSVRPEAIRRQVPSDYAPRYGSVQPRIRAGEVSSRGYAADVYAPLEDRHYSVAPQPQPQYSRRYVEDPMEVAPY